MQITGIILILIVLGLYIAWIWYTKKQSGVSAKQSEGAQEFNILVKGVYSPAVIKAKAGQPVRIKFTRQESKECSRFVVFSDFKIHQELPENKTMAVEFTPQKPGEYTFTCDMGMYQGKLIVE